MSSSEVDPAVIVLFAVLGALAIPLFFMMLGGFFVVQPRTQVVVLRWGKYLRTITEEGIAYVFPWGRRLHRVTSSVVSLDLPKMMVLEANGSPIEVSGICSYRVVEAHRAVLEIADIHAFVSLLATAVLKNVCSEYPYETPDPKVPCLRKENDTITRHMVGELQNLAGAAGVQILQMRINDLSYAPEVAQSMLLRQQAMSMLGARRTIVEGAAQTVQSASRKMVEAGFKLRGATAESFVAGLMLVLCSGERVQTVMPVAIDSAAEE